MRSVFKKILLRIRPMLARSPLLKRAALSLITNVFVAKFLRLVFKDSASDVASHGASVFGVSDASGRVMESALSLHGKRILADLDSAVKKRKKGAN